jgi:hypothetical protein
MAVGFTNLGNSLGEGDVYVVEKDDIDEDIREQDYTLARNAVSSLFPLLFTMLLLGL